MTREDRSSSVTSAPKHPPAKLAFRQSQVIYSVAILDAHSSDRNNVYGMVVMSTVINHYRYNSIWHIAEIRQAVYSKSKSTAVSHYH